MRPAAEFGRKIADAYHPNLIPILLPKQRHRVIRIDGLVDGHVGKRLNFYIAQQFLVDQVLNILQLFVFDGGEMRKIKPQMTRRHQRPRLLHMLAQNLAQTGMQKMRSRVIPHSRNPTLRIHHGIDRRQPKVPRPSFAFCAKEGGVLITCTFHHNLMRAHALNRRIASRHLGDDSVVIVRVEPSPVANLPARLSIERSPIKITSPSSPGLTSNLDTLPDDGEHVSFELCGRIPHKLGLLHDLGIPLGLGCVGSMLSRSLNSR